MTALSNLAAGYRPADPKTMFDESFWREAAVNSGGD
jgi:hypothetical protein